ncbi:hypothetical protein HD554DRAFT_2108202 [Boletus coccyginus]|nr:hypothetical protein HD554DRAFT_2108202 [Boletus coccyginus]
MGSSSALGLMVVVAESITTIGPLPDTRFLQNAVPRSLPFHNRERVYVHPDHQSLHQSGVSHRSHRWNDMLIYFLWGQVSPDPFRIVLFELDEKRCQHPGSFRAISEVDPRGSDTLNQCFETSTKLWVNMLGSSGTGQLVDCTQGFGARFRCI